MNPTLVSSEHRVRSIPGLRQSTLLAASFLFWLGFGLLMGAVELNESKQNLEFGASIAALMKFALRYVPFALVNTLLAHLFWRFSDNILTPKMMWIVPLSLLFVGVPFVTLSKTVIIELVDTQSLSKVMTTWLSYSVFNLWLVSCYLLFCYTLQVTYAIWRRSALKQSELIIAESERVALRLYLLQGQLKPHFLFNALNSIGSLVRGDDRLLAAHALRKLHGLLNYVVEVGKDESSSVGLEIDFVRDYIDMQRLRFGERMALSWDIQDKNWYSIACAPLLFQPLIENAIHHGVEPHHEVCQLRIALHVAENKVHLSLSNSLPDETLPSRGFGLGLSTTRERIELMYGAHAALDSQRLPHDFVVTLCFPAEPCSIGSDTQSMGHSMEEIPLTMTGGTK
jgi:sensor histidine kinase YesM